MDIVNKLTAKKLKFVLIKNGNLNCISLSLNILCFVINEVDSANVIIIIALMNKKGIVSKYKGYVFSIYFIKRPFIARVKLHVKTNKKPMISSFKAFFS